MKKLLLFLILFVVFTLVNCSSNDDNSSTNLPSDNFTENFGSVTNRDFIGQIINESNQPIEGVEVKVGSVTKYSDARGIFVINNATVYEKFAYITAKKSGFINGSRTVVPNSGSTTVKIMMLSATVVATVSSGTASVVPLSNGAKVSFDGNFKTESGAAYSGSVKVLMHHLDPSDPTTTDKMPGSLMAQNSDGDQRILETFGMLNVELQDASGNKLQIVNPTSIEMPISASQLASAPTTIPLWYFDEALGYWKEEGSATKVGSKYVGTVNHFSWWNCDAPFPTVSLGVNVVNANQVPMSGVRVELVINTEGGSITTSGYTNAEGQVSGSVPANQTLTMNIYITNPICPNQNIYSQLIGPFSSNTILPLVVPATEIYTTVVQGTLTNCDNAPVTNGYVYLQTEGQFLYTQVTDGSFSISVLDCSPVLNGFTLEGYDSDTSKSTLLQTETLNNQTIALGTVQACETSNISTDGLIDIDQNLYTTIAIGTQTWMQQNLNVSRYTDGTPIPQVTDNTEWANLTTGAWCYYNNDVAYGPIYGKLYNWYAVAGIYDAASLANPALRKKLAPAGYHLPSSEEWITLTNFLGGNFVAGGKMKQANTTLWQAPNLGASNETGFSALPGGWRHDYEGTCRNIGVNGYWWTSTLSTTTTEVMLRYLFYNSSGGPFAGYEQKSSGISVRFVKD
jgi:uncharacterized protein (TIGR02145 family)